MVIECSNCHARFKLADDKIKESGTKVRCTKCREVFTVFPESPPFITPPAVTTAPFVPVAPVVTPQKKVVEDALFAGTDATSFVAEIPPATANVPVSDENDWKQETAANLFFDEFPDDAGSSDLDAINFDNIEAPIFSVTSGKDSKFDFVEDSAFSFTDLSLESGTEQPYKIAEATGGKSLSVESDGTFEADYSPTAPSIPSSRDLNQFTPPATDGEFTFSETDNLADFSWNESDTTLVATTPPEQTLDTGAVQQDTAFDFSSFSFDEVVASVGSDKNISDKTVAQNETTIELSLNTEVETPTVETRHHSLDILPSPIAREHPESTPRAATSQRPRLRQKKKGSSRLAFKVIIVILLALPVTYGIINSDQIQKAYKNIVNNFIENQTRVETNGHINLVKLSGNYLINSQEGDFFVIRGEAVNEFKELRSSVLVKGTIYGDNGAILQSQSAYGGNPIKDSNLKKLSFKEIRNIMSNELGENLVNLNIATGKGIPFTIVFNNVPKNIKEFSVEVLESKPGSK